MLTIHFYGDHPPLNIPQDTDQTTEDLVVVVAQTLGVSPLARHLFALKNRTNALWISLSKKVSSLPEGIKLIFRLRFRIPSLDHLKALDTTAFLYLFHQVRADFLAGQLPELIQQPEDGLGLVVTDILHHLLSHPGMRVGDIDLKSFLPQKLNGMANRLNVKRNAEKLVENYQRKDANYVRERYLCKVEESQCAYGREEYILEREEGITITTVQLSVDPFHPEHPGIRCALQSRKPMWHHLCRIEDIVFVSIRHRDLTVEVSRRSGTPCYFKLPSIDHLHSFVGCLSGYYRLMCTWTFDLCRELSTPSLNFLRSNKCHGPVGSTFAAKKLRVKGGGDKGVGLLYESDIHYDSYTLAVLIGPDQQISSLNVLKQGDKYHVDGSDVMHNSLADLLKSLTKSEGEVKLTRVLPPSDYDGAQALLLCATKDNQVAQDDQSGPRVINMRHLTCEKELITRGRFSDLFRAQWTKQSNKEVAVKVPKLNSMVDTEHFLAVISDLCLVQCECIVGVYGVCLNPPALVMEMLTLGPLHTYLTQKKELMKEVELVEAATYLAKALWYLNTEGIHHNNIRCHNILVADHTDTTFKVKLADPGMVRYDQRDLHWIPREYHSHPPMALRDPTTDTWAFATTLWQIFSYGDSPLPGADMEEVRSLYSTGHLLARPDPCPPDLYKVMVRCWCPDPQARRQPQAIMRDVNSILYRVFNSRKTHAYQTISQPANENESQNGEVEAEDEEEDNENASVTTQLTTLTYSDGSANQVTFSQLPDNVVEDLISVRLSPTPPNILCDPATRSTLAEILLPPDAAHRLVDLTPAPPSQPLCLDKANIEFGMMIGEGNFGQVYRGLMADAQGRQETVAIKRLKPDGETAGQISAKIDELKREVNIMKELRHPNIVRLLGLVESDDDGGFMCMVMEYLPMGSLKEYLKTRTDHITDTLLLKFALDIAEGMDYLEQRRVIHRDLAARNILVAGSQTVKITDFGLAQTPNRGNYYIRQTNRALPLRWYALECIEHGRFSHKSDVWSYGVTCWEMFTRGEEPHLPQKPDILIQQLRIGHRLNLVKPCPDGVYNKLIRPCWDKEPQARPNFSTLITVVEELQAEFYVR
ncbi:hypothetical protein Pmani_028482 [Petrolisthes manimaculis]|uniref:non-specific protein-tyrosine kinase n=1 Tax=Petrolisthes manimaculis TaxID=1843537 RepID=A0AAE1NZF5_9EUCA|nr:hypothetical protein Pmani_028482 [Petrolisthes manimaculis]